MIKVSRKHGDKDEDASVEEEDVDDIEVGITGGEGVL